MLRVVLLLVVAASFACGAQAAQALRLMANTSPPDRCPQQKKTAHWTPLSRSGTSVTVEWKKRKDAMCSVLW